MILQALAGYYDRLSAGSGIAQEGFQSKDIPFVIVLDDGGNFIDLWDTREGEGKKKKARAFIVPRESKRSGTNAWKIANLLWDNPGYVLGVPFGDDKALKQHQSFMDLLHSTFPQPTDVGITSVIAYLSRMNFSKISTHPLWDEMVEAKGNLSFKLVKDTCLVCERPTVITLLTLNATLEEGDGILQTCMITGEQDVPACLHASIKGVYNTNSTGANIVSFNLSAFESYGKTQGFNAPIGRKSEFRYTTALNALLKNPLRRFQVGDASTVFWAEKDNKLEEVFLELFAEPAKDKASKDSSSLASDQDHRDLLALIRSPQSAASPELDPNTRFYVLGLAPNAARIAVRFWYAAKVGEVADNIALHFDDTAIIHSSIFRKTLSIKELLKATAPSTSKHPYGDPEKILPNMAGDLMKAVLAGTPYPHTLLALAVGRCRAEQSKKDSRTGKQMENVPYARVAIIKAVLVRQSRFFNTQEKEIGMSLDTSNTNIGYRLGRLFAVLEKVQEEASPGLNATIRDRFYGSASGTPEVAFSHLMKLKNHHLAKIENKGRAINLERLIGEIVDGINDFPSHLDLHDQGRFAVGYYHQRQNFFTKNEQ